MRKKKKDLGRVWYLILSIPDLCTLTYFYIPSAELTKRERDERNCKNRKILRNYYQREKEKKRRQENTISETSGYKSGATYKSFDGRSNQLHVRLDFPKKRIGALKRWKRDISVANTRIKRLENERDNMLRKYISAQRTVRGKKAAAYIKDTDKKQNTPRKQIESLMEEASLTQEQEQKIRKPLSLENVLEHNNKATKENTTAQNVKLIHSVVSGKTIKNIDVQVY